MPENIGRAVNTDDSSSTTDPTTHGVGADAKKNGAGVRTTIHDAPQTTQHTPAPFFSKQDSATNILASALQPSKTTIHDAPKTTQHTAARFYQENLSPTKTWTFALCRLKRLFMMPHGSPTRQRTKMSGFVVTPTKTTSVRV